MISLELEKDDWDALPLYFVWGSKRELTDFEEFERELARAPRLHKAATAEAERSVRTLGAKLIVSHKLFLDVAPV